MHLLFYNIFLWIYGISVRIAAWSNPKAKLWVAGRKDLYRRLSSAIAKVGPPVVWIHCSSLGEFEQGKPIMDAIRKNFPSTKILLTFFSPSGYEPVKNYKEADYIFYLPSDSKYNARKFIDIIQPRFVLWVKYDYWYYYLSELKKRNIPVILVSGLFRKELPFFKWYGRLHRYMLQSFSHLLVQTESSRQLLASIGFSKNVTVCGDTRFDRVVQIAEQFEPIPLVAHFCNNCLVIVAGSTWEADEEALDHYANIHPDIKFIIAPHEIDEEHLKDVEKLFKRSVRYSHLKDVGNEIRDVGYGMADSRLTTNDSLLMTPNVLIIDNIGMLSRLYKYATITYVGGGFRDGGVHNVLEAAVYGKPVLFGSVFDKYIEAIELIDEGGAFTVENALELESLLNEILSDKQLYRESSEAAKKYVYAKKGATEKIIQFIQEKRLFTN